MCELCAGEFERIETLEVAQCAWLSQRIDSFGAFYIVLENKNVDDEHIQMCMDRPDATKADRLFGSEFMKLTVAERISALALSNRLWGTCRI